MSVGSAGSKKGRRRQRPSNPDAGSTIPPVAYGFVRQGGMSGVAGFVGAVRALRHGNASQQRAARILLGVLLGLPVLALIAVGVAAIITS